MSRITSKVSTLNEVKAYDNRNKQFFRLLDTATMVN